MSRREPEGAQAPERRVPPKLIVGVVVAIVVVWWALANTHSVKVSWIVTDSKPPLIVVIVVAAVLGFVGGWVVARVRARR